MFIDYHWFSLVLWTPGHHVRVRGVWVVHVRTPHLLTATVHSTYTVVVLSGVVGATVHANIVQLAKILTAIRTATEFAKTFDRLLHLRLVGIQRHYYGVNTTC